MEDHSTQDDSKTVNAWFDAHHDETVDAVSFSVNTVGALVSLLMRQPEFADWEKERIEDAVVYDEKDQMNNMTGQLDEMQGMEIVGWVGQGFALCPEHISEKQADAKGMQPIFASNEGWEDITCDDHRDGIHTLGDTAGISEDMTMGSST